MAAARGIRIVPTCGYDSIPSDLGAFFLAQHAREKLGKCALLSPPPSSHFPPLFARHQMFRRRRRRPQTTLVPRQEEMTMRQGIQIGERTAARGFLVLTHVLG